MKQTNQLFFFLLILLYSCGQKSTNELKQTFSYQLDTVLIDSKSENLDLNRFLMISSLDIEKKSIFTYNEFDHSLDQIDLEEFVFKRKYPFEKFGPDGTGEFFYEFNTLEDGRLFVKSYEKSAIFEPNGILNQSIDWVNSLDSTGNKYGEFPRRQILVELDELMVFGLSYDDLKRDVNLDIFSLEKNRVRRLDLKSKKPYTDLILQIDQTSIFIDPQVYLVLENDKIIVSYEFSNEIAFFDSKTDELRFVNYNTSLTPESAKPINSNIIGSKAQLQKEFQHYLEQVKYYPPVWDNIGKQFLRLSTKSVFSEVNNEKSLVPETEEIKVFLSIFDSSFNLISELEIHELSYSSGKYFAKDGKLWIFTSLDDEIGFVRVSLNER